MRRVALVLALALAAPSAMAQTRVDSDRVEAVSVTLYRDPYRGAGAIQPGWPGGYALITETRTLRLPAGPAVIRFIGVSEGMLPETAIVSGLPRPPREKNRDARLISPAALVDAYLKRRVTLKRTNRATGAVKIQDAVIQSGPNGGVLVTTREGVEALGCSGLPESLSYPRIPDDLSAKPSFSVITETETAATVTVQLSYLAQGFDWSANYVARMGEDGATLDLFAWLAVANGGSQGFVDSHTQAVAGGLHREGAALLPHGPASDLHLQCWPMDVTSTHPRWSIDRAPPPPPMLEAVAFDMVVTDKRMRLAGLMAALPPPPPPPVPMMAQQEELGDLKLYRIPEPVTVAAQSTKQVAMIDRKGVRFDTFYTGIFPGLDYGARSAVGSLATARVLRMQNRDTDGLGLALPAGGVAVFDAAANGTPMLIGESKLRDRAIGDEVELGAGQSDEVRYVVTAAAPSRTRKPFAVRVTNARRDPATFEMLLPGKIASTSAALIERKGQKAWRVVVPANGETVLHVAFATPR